MSAFHFLWTLRGTHIKKNLLLDQTSKNFEFTQFIGSHNILFFFHCCCAKSQSVIDPHQARNISLSFTYQLKAMTINNKRPSVTTLSKCVQLQMTKIGKQSHMLLFVLFFFFYMYIYVLLWCFVFYECQKHCTAAVNSKWLWEQRRCVQF